MVADTPRPGILVTNDDGYDAPGIAALIEAVEPLGDVTVVAPETEQSASSHSLTIHRPLRMFRVCEGRWRVDGTPTDCVHLGIHGLPGLPAPDLIVSGMNRGLNVGDDVTYSGTVAGALEGALLGIPAIAFSVDLDDRRHADYPNAVPFARTIAARVLETGLPPGVLLNVNFPRPPYRGVRVTRQGTRSYRANVLERLDPSGRPYYWIAGDATTPGGELDGDHRAIVEGHVSVTPLRADLTHEPSVGEIERWSLELP